MGAKQQTQKVAKRMGKAGIARGVGVTPTQAKMDTYSDSLSLINQAESRMRSEYKTNLEDMQTQFQDQRDIAEAEFENVIGVAMNEMFADLEGLGMDFETSALNIEEDYWSSLNANLSSLALAGKLDDFGIDFE